MVGYILGGTDQVRSPVKRFDIPIPLGILTKERRHVWRMVQVCYARLQ